MPKSKNGLVLNLQELNELKHLTAFDFGKYSRYRKESKMDKMVLLFKAFNLLQDKIYDLKTAENQNQEALFNSYLRFGHIAILGEDYSRALSAYQHAYAIDESKFGISFGASFGLALTYFHFKQFNLAIEAFNNHLFVFTSHSSSVEVHCYLGIAYQTILDFSKALKHLNIALKCNQDCFLLSKEEIKFYIGHCFDCAGDKDKAKSEYQAILDSSANLTNTLKGALYRQLGWISYKSGNVGEAERLLSKSLELDPTCGKTAYYIGRCHSEGGDRAHAAFTNYRRSFDKTETEADTWSSIGLLYQQQNQPLDAIQAFVSSIYLDPDHSAAWINLGHLYETYFGFHDALDCYKKAVGLHCFENDKIKKRIEVLERELKFVAQYQVAANSVKIFKPPTLELAQRLPIPSELRKNIADNLSKHKERYVQGSPLWTCPELLAYSLRKTNKMIDTSTGIQYQTLDILNINKDQLNEMETSFLKILEEKLEPVSEVSRYQNRFDKNMTTNVEMSFPPASQEKLNNARKYLEHFNDSSMGEDSEGSCEKSDEIDDAIDQLIETEPQEMMTEELPAFFSLITDITIPMSATSGEIFKHSESNNNNNYAFVPAYKSKQLITMFEAPTKELSPSELVPQTTCLHVDTPREAHSIELQDYCYSNPITLVRGLTSVLKIDLALFSTKTLLETGPQQEVEVRTQYKFNNDANTDHSGNPSWQYYSKKSYSTLLNYARYQVGNFNKNMKDETEKLKNTPAGKYNSNDNEAGPPAAKKRKNASKIQLEEVKPSNIPMKTLKFGTNVDLSDSKTFSLQQKELDKLPAFCRIEAACNMLTHLDHTIYGMNTPQLYMKIPGARTPAHQENNCLASINISTGPGECEWFGVAYEYLPVIEKMCKAKGVDFLKGSWWPSYEDLHEAKVPVFRFMQRAGDMVFVNSGCIHWVQSHGWCNNISWNVGPLTPFQLETAFFSYEWNLQHNYKSLVPMQHLCWQLARNVRFTISKLYRMVKTVLVKSLSYQKMIRDHLDHLGKTVKTQDRIKGELTHYCSMCEVEVHNILFVKEADNSVYIVYCAHCARKVNPLFDGFIVLQQCELKELCDVYDQFHLHPSKTPLIC
uniref:JmjC domain-containing protein n=1 Tax=Rhabditophanes sp. KR3021 TaxID=114890 RepID=A0AC35TK80_9BILA